MTTAFAIARWLAIVAVCLLSSAATNLTADALDGDLTLYNIQRVLGDDEVERFTDGVQVQHAILDLQTAAWYAGDIDLSNVDEWLGLEFAEGFDDNDNATSWTRPPPMRNSTSCGMRSSSSSRSKALAIVSLALPPRSSVCTRWSFSW